MCYPCADTPQWSAAQIACGRPCFDLAGPPASSGDPHIFMCCCCGLHLASPGTCKDSVCELWHLGGPGSIPHPVPVSPPNSEQPTVQFQFPAFPQPAHLTSRESWAVLPTLSVGTAGLRVGRHGSTKPSSGDIHYRIIQACAFFFRSSDFQWVTQLSILVPLKTCTSFCLCLSEISKEPSFPSLAFGRAPQVPFRVVSTHGKIPQLQRTLSRMVSYSFIVPNADG